jgi:hypothetical protein
MSRYIEEHRCGTEQLGADEWWAVNAGTSSTTIPIATARTKASATRAMNSVVGPHARLRRRWSEPTVNGRGFDRPAHGLRMIRGLGDSPDAGAPRESTLDRASHLAPARHDVIVPMVVMAFG